MALKGVDPQSQKKESKLLNLWFQGKVEEVLAVSLKKGLRLFLSLKGKSINLLTPEKLKKLNKGLNNSKRVLGKRRALQLLQRVTKND
tara:strand:+ start:382 stop:645 length:264 start_codon:yes stop_codon:yes gene_type:complete